MRVDVKDASKASGVNAWGYSANNTCAQDWTIERTNDGYYTFANSCGGKMLDVLNGNAVARQNVWVYNRNGSNAQKWILQAL